MKKKICMCITFIRVATLIRIENAYEVFTNRNNRIRTHIVWNFIRLVKWYVLFSINIFLWNLTACYLELSFLGNNLRRNLYKLQEKTRSSTNQIQIHSSMVIKSGRLAGFKNLPTAGVPSRFISHRSHVFRGPARRWSHNIIRIETCLIASVDLFVLVTSATPSISGLPAASDQKKILN